MHTDKELMKRAISYAISSTDNLVEEYQIDEEELYKIKVQRCVQVYGGLLAVKMVPRLNDWTLNWQDRWKELNEAIRND